MSQHDTAPSDVHSNTHHADDNNSDSTVDAICAVMLISIAVITMIYWVSQQ